MHTFKYTYIRPTHTEGWRSVLGYRFFGTVKLAVQAQNAQSTGKPIIFRSDMVKFSCVTDRKIVRSIHI